MSLGFDTYEDDRDFNQKGITGEIQRYTKEKMQYPCYIIRNEKNHMVGKHQLTVLKNMFNTSVVYSSGEDGEVNSVNIYFHQDGKTFRLGRIFAKQVKPFLELFSNNIIDCYLDENTELKGKYKYVLSE